jgi:hypothetical protein
MHLIIRKLLTGTGIKYEDFSIAFSLSNVSEIEHFVAREEELAEMYGTLSGDGSRRTVVLHGLGAARTKTERFTLHGSCHLTTSNNRTNFRPSFFVCGRTLIIRISGTSFFGTAIQRIQSGYVSLLKTS